MLSKSSKRMPDVLDCLANLSNDEVFTPPEIANRMLDLLPQEVFDSKETTFLDPFTKSGVFLREITRRLLSHQIPDYEAMAAEIDMISKTAIQDAVKAGFLNLRDADYDDKAMKVGRDAIDNHPRACEFYAFEDKLQVELNRILKTQVFGIAITELTAQLTRRSLYCSKNAAGPYSISTKFDDSDGNIRYNACQHVWNKKPKYITLDKKWRGGTCIFCGASSEMFERPDDLEQHAYEFIHTPNAEGLFNMKFDVICGNPPYQLADGSGGSSDSAMPIYNKFIEQAQRLDPQYLTMIIPSKWMVGGRGLNKFRQTMIDDMRIKCIVDYENERDCFGSGVHIDGGVCYFLWQKDYAGPVDYKFIAKNGDVVQSKRNLRNSYFDYVIRDQRILSILEKCSIDGRFSDIVSSVKPYGIRGYLFNEPARYPDSGLSGEAFPDSVHIYGVKGIKGGAKRVDGYVRRDFISVNSDTIDNYKIFFTTSYSTGAVNPPKAILGQPGDVCTETFLLIGNFEKEDEQLNCLSYMETTFFKFLLYFGKGTMHVNKGVFGLIPIQDFSKPWTDEELYQKYNLTQEEIDFIESMIRPME